MSTPRMQRSPRALRDIVDRGFLKNDPFVLLDVGASGGIESYWNAFGDSLRATGFEPLVKEVERLNRVADGVRVRYIDAFVGADDLRAPGGAAGESEPLSETPRIYERLSSTLAQKLTGFSFTQRFNNGDPDLVYAHRRLSLDRFCESESMTDVDFIKVDTDGYDYEVIMGATQTLRNRGVLGLLVECQFHGTDHEHSNTFANIDRELRSAGFSLFDLELHRYTRAALPGRFKHGIFAQTDGGQVIWGDALYLRDYAADGYAARWGALTQPKLLKLVALQELFGLADCAAELLLRFRELSEPLKSHSGEWLDLLAREADSLALGYRELQERFAVNPGKFLPESEAKRDALRLVQQAIMDGVPSVVVYGGGALGREVVEAAQSRGLIVKFIVDSNTALHGTRIAGVSVVSIEDALASGATAIIVASVVFESDIIETIRRFVSSQTVRVSRLYSLNRQ